MSFGDAVGFAGLILYQVQFGRRHIVVSDGMAGICLLIDSNVVDEGGSLLGFSPIEGQMGRIFNNSEVVQCP